MIEEMAVVSDTIVADIFISLLLSMNWLVSMTASISLKAVFLKLVYSKPNHEKYLLLYPFIFCVII
jgi:hypothetical protein